MHLYTLLQTAGLVLLYAVKSSRFSLALPFFLVLMVPLRMALAFLFTPLQLRAVRTNLLHREYRLPVGTRSDSQLLFIAFQLDGAQKDKDEDDEPDFYQEAPLPG